MVRMTFPGNEFDQRISHLDEATEAKTNSSLTTNEIIEDTQSNQGDIYPAGWRGLSSE